MNSPIEPRCITLEEAAAYVGLKPRSYRAAVHRGIYPIPGTKRESTYPLANRYPVQQSSPSLGTPASPQRFRSQVRNFAATLQLFFRPIEEKLHGLIYANAYHPHIAPLTDWGVL